MKDFKHNQFAIWFTLATLEETNQSANSSWGIMEVAMESLKFLFWQDSYS